MTSLLSLCAEFFDQLSSPRQGIETSETAGERLAALLRNDDARGRFVREVAALSDPGELSIDGWFWILQFARANAIELDARLLQRLCLRWSSSQLVALAIDSGLGRNVDDEIATAASIDDVADPWLRQVVAALRPAPPPDDDPDADGDIDLTTRIRQTEVVFTALLIVDRPPAIAAARAMLRTQEELSVDLTSLVRSRMELLDDDARQSWEEQLGAS